MLEELYSAPDLTIHFRPDLQLLTVRWRGEATTERLRAQYAAIVAAAQQVKVGYWLLDVRRRSQPTTDMAIWITQTWLPQAAAALAPRHVCVAYLLSPLRATLLETDEQLSAITTQLKRPEQPFCLETFIDEGAAVHWLREQAATE